MMSIKRSPAFLILLALVFGLTLAPAGAQAPRKLRIAVLNFDYEDVRSETSAFFGSSIDVGIGIHDVLSADLAKEGTFSLVGQDAVEKAASDISFSDSDRNDPVSAANLGRLLHADAVIIGAVREFNTGTQSGDSSAPSPDSKTKVRLEARIVDTETGQIQATAESAGEATGSATILLGGWKGWGRENPNFASVDFQETAIGKAVKAAVDQLSTRLAPNASKVLRTTAKPDGVVAAVDGSQIILNIGSGNGIMPGDLLEAFRFTKEVKDPSTGEVIRYLTSTVGVIKATDVDAKSAICTIVSGSGFQEGDHVRAAQ